MKNSREANDGDNAVQNILVWFFFLITPHFFVSKYIYQNKA